MNATRILVASAIVCSAVAPPACAAPREPPAGATGCTGCHPSSAAVTTAVPRLAGRDAAEIVAQMQAFRAGQRPATVMDRIAKGFSDAEIQAIAAWYAMQRER
jgi:cytochrome subunit of sulfide dehydrogenase